MPTTIDKLEMSAYLRYAEHSMMVERTNQQWRLDQAGSIPPQISILDVYPKLAELDLLLGISPVVASWAYFFPPPNFMKKRRSPFGVSRLLPSLGDEEEQEEQEHRAASQPCADEEEVEEKNAIMKCFAQISKINGWLGYIIGHRGQFLQG